MTGVIAIVVGLAIGMMLTREGREAPGVYVLGVVIVASLAAGVVVELIA